MSFVISRNLGQLAALECLTAEEVRGQTTQHQPAVNPGIYEVSGPPAMQGPADSGMWSDSVSSVQRISLQHPIHTSLARTFTFK